VIGVVLLMILLAIAFGLARLGAVVAIELVAGFLALGVGTFLFVLAIAFVADVVVALMIGRLVLPDRETSQWQELGALAVGLLVVVIVTSLPVIGGLAKLAVILFGLGALLIAAWSRWRGRAATVTTAPVEPAPPAGMAPTGG
jgi:hypothetical protein